MTTTPHPDRGYWDRRVRSAVGNPNSLSAILLNMVGLFLSDPRASSDHLLILADGLRQIARDEEAAGVPNAARQLSAIVNLLIDEAPRRANADPKERHHATATD